MNKTPIVKIEEHHKEKVIAFRVDCENPESVAWGLEVEDAPEALLLNS